MGCFNKVLFVETSVAGNRKYFLFNIRWQLSSLEAAIDGHLTVNWWTLTIIVQVSSARVDHSITIVGVEHSKFGCKRKELYKLKSSP